MKKGEGHFYKIARPNGWDFYTGKTINYREAIGHTVSVPNPGRAPVALCSPGVIHASKVAEECFQGGKVPCSLYHVQGTPVVQDDTKAGFLQFDVLKEIDPATHFKWRYVEAANPINPFTLPPPEITAEHLALLFSWDSVGDSVWASVRASVGAYTGWIFQPVVAAWAEVYPYQAVVDLWHQGIVPSYDGKMWRLHGGLKAKILWEGKQ